jgi:selenocysteine lyase/cysteine desulfurase
MAEGAKRFENYESYVAGRIGLAKAVEYAQAVGLKCIEERVTALADELRGRLAELPGVSIHDQGERRCGIVTFHVADEAPSVTAARLKEAKINVSVSVRRYAQLDFGARDLDAVTRASVHYYNTEEEVVRFVRAVAEGG